MSFTKPFITLPPSLACPTGRSMPFRTGTHFSGPTLSFSGAPLAACPPQGLVGRPIGTVLSTGATQQGGAGKATSGFQECQKAGIGFVLVRVAEIGRPSCRE